MLLLYFFFFKQKPAYEIRISDWSSEVCSSDLVMHVAKFASEGIAPVFVAVRHFTSSITVAGTRLAISLMMRSRSSPVAVASVAIRTLSDHGEDRKSVV